MNIMQEHDTATGVLCHAISVITQPIFSMCLYARFLVTKYLLFRSQGSKKAIREKAKEFSLKCRGFYGTLYASETT